jgi:hypothetical protein
MAWRLICDCGQQIWKYLNNENSTSIDYDKQNPNSNDKIYREYAIQQNYKPLNIDENEYENYTLQISHQVKRSKNEKNISTFIQNYNCT